MKFRMLRGQGRSTQLKRTSQSSIGPISWLFSDAQVKRFDDKPIRRGASPESLCQDVDFCAPSGHVAIRRMELSIEIVKLDVVEVEEAYPDAHTGECLCNDAPDASCADHSDVQASELRFGSVDPRPRPCG